MGHDLQDRIGLELGRRIAAELPRRPEWIVLARANLDRWSRRNASAPGLLRCYEEWRAILDRPVIEICAVLTSPTQDGQRLRQSSPFAGALPPSEVSSIKHRLHHEQTAA